MEEFAMERAERGGCAVLAVKGEVDLATAPRLREALADLAAEGHLLVVVDFTGTEFLDSTGLGALVAGVKRVRAKGGDLRVVVTAPRVRKVFELTGLDRVLRVHGSVDDACAPA